jgi:hypothetical protein
MDLSWRLNTTRPLLGSSLALFQTVLNMLRPVWALHRYDDRPQTPIIRRSTTYAANFMFLDREKSSRIYYPKLGSLLDHLERMFLFQLGATNSWDITRSTIDLIPALASSHRPMRHVIDSQYQNKESI